MACEHHPAAFSARSFWRRLALCPALLLIAVTPLQSAILWSDLGTTIAHDSLAGTDILGGAVRRDDRSDDTLYFKFHVNPLSDVSTEEYFAAFELFEQGEERLGVGNSMAAWAYSAFNTATSGEFNQVFGDLDLRSLRPEPASSPGVPLPYELPRRGIENTIVFKVKYVPGSNDEVTVWLNPDLSPGATEADQPAGLTTRFPANASFDEIRLRHGGGGRGWAFSDMAVATSFDDLVGNGPIELGAGSGGAGGATRLTVRSWQDEQGLPQNTIYAVAQTSDGYLWAGTDDGVSRFDGVRFVSFGSREGLPANPTRVLLADKRGALWIGTAGGGLACLSGGQCHTFTSRDGLPSDTITVLAQDSQERIWVGTDAGLTIVREGKAIAFAAGKEFDGRTITALNLDRHGTMWVGVKGAGVFRLVDDRFVPLGDGSVESLLQDPHCVLEDRLGRIWIGAGDDFVLCRDEQEWHRYRIPRHLSHPFVTTLAEKADGTVWAGSVSEGVFEFKDGKLSPVDARSGLPDNFVKALMVDREDNLWVGTSAGLSRVSRSKLTVFEQNDGLGYGPVQGLAEIQPGIVWACKPGDGLYQRKGRLFTRLSFADPSVRNASVSSVLAAGDGTVWVSTADGLLHFRSPLSSNLVSDAVALPGKHVTALLEHRDGSIWAGTREGELWSEQPAGWQKLFTVQPPHAIAALAIGIDGSLWAGTDGDGVFQWNGKLVGRFDKKSGLLSDTICTLHSDAAGVLWIGTAGGGLAALMNGRVRNFTSREGLPDNTIVQMLEDDTGTLWLGSRRGIAGVSKRDLAAVGDGLASAIYPQIYGRTDGMPSEECAGGFFPAGLRSKAGQLWFSTLKGIVVIDPHARQQEPAPMVRIEEVIVDEASVDFGGRTLAGGIPAATPLRIAPGKKRIEFHYSGLSFAAPERVRFRYRLAGLDPAWVEAGTRRAAFYGYLPPGDYQFRVIACNSAGVWNETGAVLPVQVMRRFYQSPWFITLAAIALLGVVAGSVRMAEKRRLHRRLRQLEQERAVERERARIAQDLHDELGSSLTRLSLLSDLLKREQKTDPEQAEQRATRISATSTQTVRALEEIVWALRPGSDTVQSLIEYIAHFAKELFEADATRCRLDLPDELPHIPLPPEMRHNIFLIVKEALTNTLKHAQAGEVLVKAEVDETSLRIVVTDNGRGCQIPSPDTGTHNGLGNMQRRADAMGGALNIESHPGQGTRVSLTVRLPKETRPMATAAGAHAAEAI